MNFLKKLFPFISAAASLGGPLGVMAANAVGKAIGVDKVDPSPQGIADALKQAGATADVIAKVQEAEQQFALDMQKMGFQHVEDLEKIAADDRASAREREKVVRDKTPQFGFYIITVGFFGLLYWLMRAEPPAGSRDVLNIMLGALGTAWIAAVTYYYGSSAGSEQKNSLLAQKGKE